MARYSQKAGAFQVTWTDGIIEWYGGPEWDEEALAQFVVAETQLEEAARALAQWEDRSGEARDGLTAQAFNNNGVITMALYHTVEYGVWLELIQNGRFAVIMRALEQEAPRIIDNAVRRIKYARRGTLV